MVKEDRVGRKAMRKGVLEMKGGVAGEGVWGVRECWKVKMTTRR